MIYLCNRPATYTDAKGAVVNYTQYYIELNLGKLKYDLVVKLKSANDKAIVNMSKYVYITCDLSSYNGNDFYRVIANCVIGEDGSLPIQLSLDDNQKTLIRLALLNE